MKTRSHTHKSASAPSLTSSSSARSLRDARGRSLSQPALRETADLTASALSWAELSRATSILLAGVVALVELPLLPGISLLLNNFLGPVLAIIVGGTHYLTRLSFFQFSE